MGLLVLRLVRLLAHHAWATAGDGARLEFDGRRVLTIPQLPHAHHSLTPPCRLHRGSCRVKLSLRAVRAARVM
jgi:hypothetical protein